MKREYYSASIADFRNTDPDTILGKLTRSNPFTLDQTQLDAWLEEVTILQRTLVHREGRIYFEYAIPRMGKYVDVILLIGPAIFVLEFKIGEKRFASSAIDQVYDYALDLENFHETSYNRFIAPILIPTKARNVTPQICATTKNSKLISPIRCTVGLLGDVISEVLRFAERDEDINSEVWENGRYCPTPTIIEAALALYKGHSVTEISRNDATAINLTTTSEAIARVINSSKEKSQKSICFVTGVPGAGKTLVGLDTATRHQDEQDAYYSVFLSGNGPLVAILREALARDHVENERKHKRKIRKGEARSKVRAFVQNVHHFRDECIKDRERAPIEHVALFDEAQRAWDLKRTRQFMRGARRKNKVVDFDQSEPEFLISCLNRHLDWAVIVCLVGGGQEINTGEAGIAEWIKSLNRSFPEWHIYISARLADSEYGAGKVLKELSTRANVTTNDNLHLAVSMRSFRAENVSRLVKEILDLEAKNARQTLAALNTRYPIVITRDLTKAKQWLRTQARGSERYGIVVSSQAERLRPHAINVKTKVNPVHWFLHSKEDVRSSYYLEDVATEFSIQGLELDWVCVNWDADFRHTPKGWQHWSFSGVRWNHIRKAERKVYLKNAYRVLMTRARQGMVIVVPPGDSNDPTRKPEFYDPTFEYLQEVGFTTI